MEGREGEDPAKVDKCLARVLVDLAKLLNLSTGAQARFRNFHTSTTGAFGAKKKKKKEKLNDNHSHLEFEPKKKAYSNLDLNLNRL